MWIIIKQKFTKHNIYKCNIINIYTWIIYVTWDDKAPHTKC